MIKVPLGDGRTLEVDTDDQQAAAQEAREFVAREKG
jgi:hypothetical protein